MALPRTRLAVLLAILLAAALPHTTTAQALPDLAAIDRIIEEQMEEYRIPGVGLSIVGVDGAIHERGFGRADSSGRPVTAQTPFFVMSITKSFTALILMQLHEEGAVDLDAPVQRYLPWFRVADEQASTIITLRHLASNSAGLPTFIPGEFERLLDAPTPGDPEREVRRLADVELLAAPGERMIYSNVGWTTLAVVIEAIEGKPYEDVVEARVFAPLGMTHAHARKEDAVADGLATGHASWFGFPVPLDWSSSRIGVGSGFTYASAEDLGRFAQMHLNAGRTPAGTRIVSAEGIATMQVPIVQARPEPHPQSYGIGWFIEDVGGARIVHHGGSGPNYRSEVILLPDHGYAVALAGSVSHFRQGDPVGNLALTIAGMLAGTRHEPQNGAGIVNLAFNVLWIGNAVGLVGLAYVGHHIASPRRGRTLKPGRAMVASAGWIGLTVLATPAVLGWPMANMRLSLPDVALGIWVAAAIGSIHFALATLTLARRRAERAS